MFYCSPTAFASKQLLQFLKSIHLLVQMQGNQENKFIFQ